MEPGVGSLSLVVSGGVSGMLVMSSTGGDAAMVLMPKFWCCADGDVLVEPTVVLCSVAVAVAMEVVSTMGSPVHFFQLLGG